MRDNMEVDARFDKLEIKLDKMSDSLTKLVELDTRLDHFSQNNIDQDKRMDAITVRLNKLNDLVIKNTESSRIAERIFFIILTSAITFMAYILPTQ
jgi:DNA repair ATPase RecN|tara:strand:+ start:3115 stop:3402 length:288 start_codon:yes stop_codon:yes gene_type:complete